MTKKRFLLFVLLSPFALLFLLIVLICGSKYFDPSADEIHALIPQRAATEKEAIEWLKSEHRMCAPRLVSAEEKQDAAGFHPEKWRNGIASADLNAASSMIFTVFEVKPRSVDSSWARNVLQYYLYFDAEGKLMAARSESICFGF